MELISAAARLKYSGQSPRPEVGFTITLAQVPILLIELDPEQNQKATNMENQVDPSAQDGTSAVPSLKMLKNALYAQCANRPAESIFTQDELLSLEVIPNNDLEKLLSCTRQLTKEGLFKLMTKDGRACWKVVKRDDAAKCGKNPEIL